MLYRRRYSDCVYGMGSDIELGIKQNEGWKAFCNEIGIWGDMSQKDQASKVKGDGRAHIRKHINMNMDARSFTHASHADHSVLRLDHFRLQQSTLPALAE